MGDSIIIPSDMRMLETTISITRKGKKSRKPIVKAVRNSLIRKAAEKERLKEAKAAERQRKRDEKAAEKERLKS